MTKGQRIRKLREDFGISQTSLAEKVNISKQTLYKYENDIITNIPSDVIEEIANALGSTPIYLMGWDSSTPAAPSASLRSDEADLLGDYNKLNPEGQRIARATVKGLTANEEYIKDTSMIKTG